MTIISNIEKTLFGIRRILINDVVIRKLLFNNVPAAIAGANPTIEQVEKLVSVNPLVNFNTNENNSDIFNFITIYNSSVFNAETSYDVNIIIDVYVSQEHFLLDGEQTRLLQLLNRIGELIEEKKLALAGKLVLDDVTIRTIADSNLIGYTTTWATRDGKSNEF